MANICAEWCLCAVEATKCSSLYKIWVTQGGVVKGGNWVLRTDVKNVRKKGVGFRGNAFSGLGIGGAETVFAGRKA